MRMPTRDLCADLRVDPSEAVEFGGAVPVCSATNRQLRLYVAAWMLSDEYDTPRAALNAARQMYEGCGRALLDRPGRLTTAAIAAEVVRIAPVNPELDGR